MLEVTVGKGFIVAVVPELTTFTGHVASDVISTVNTSPLLKLEADTE